MFIYLSIFIILCHFNCQSVLSAIMTSQHNSSPRALTNSAIYINEAGPSDLHNEPDAQDASIANLIDSSQSHTTGASYGGRSTMAPIADTLKGSVPFTDTLTDTLNFILR